MLQIQITIFYLHFPFYLFEREFRKSKKSDNLWRPVKTSRSPNP